MICSYRHFLMFLPPLLWSSLLILILESFIAAKTPFPALVKEKEDRTCVLFTAYLSRYQGPIVSDGWTWVEQKTFCLLVNPKTQHDNVYNIRENFVTQLEIWFWWSYPPCPTPATSPLTVRTVNHKTRVSSVSTLILTGSHINTITKGLWCLQQDDKWEP